MSRSGKTQPRSICHYSLVSAWQTIHLLRRLRRQPFTKVFKEHKNKLFGLMIDAERLVAIRNERKANSRYASFSRCQMELRAIEGIYISEGIKYLNVTEMSIEEFQRAYLQLTGLKRRIG
ncbi:MAG: kinase/pyrophosphorylase [Acinetobacter sp.]